MVKSSLRDLFLQNLLADLHSGVVEQPAEHVLSWYFLFLLLELVVLKLEELVTSLIQPCVDFFCKFVKIDSCRLLLLLLCLASCQVSRRQVLVVTNHCVYELLCLIHLSSCLEAQCNILDRLLQKVTLNSVSWRFCLRHLEGGVVSVDSLQIRAAMSHAAMETWSWHCGSQVKRLRFLAFFERTSHNQALIHAVKLNGQVVASARIRYVWGWETSEISQGWVVLKQQIFPFFLFFREVVVNLRFEYNALVREKLALSSRSVFHFI